MMMYYDVVYETVLKKYRESSNIKAMDLAPVFPIMENALSWQEEKPASEKQLLQLSQPISMALEIIPGA